MIDNLIDAGKVIRSHRKGVQTMGNEKIMAEINGVQYEVSSFIAFYENNVLRISLTIVGESNNKPTVDKPTISPTVRAQNTAQSFELANPYVTDGTQYGLDDNMTKRLKELSNLRSNPEKEGVKATKELKSATYNVKDINSFNDAVTDIVNQENELFDQDYRFYTEVVKPTTIFTSETSGNFELTEKIAIIKVSPKKED